MKLRYVHFFKIEEEGIATEPSEDSMMKKLKKMGLEKFYGKFVEQRITEDMFPEITESYINELGFFIGDKIRWKRHFPEKPEAAPPSIPAKRRKQNHSVEKGSVVVKKAVSWGRQFLLETFK